MFFSATASLIADAHGRTSWNVKNDIGAASPGRWHDWQFFSKIGATSLLKVMAPGTFVPAAFVAATTDTQSPIPTRANRILIQESSISNYTEAICARQVAWRPQILHHNIHPRIYFSHERVDDGS
jgi:hypothetical protein